MKCLLAGLALLVSVNVFAQSPAQTTLTWCAYYNWAPWIYPGPTGDLRGILIEQLRTFEQQHGLTTQNQNINNWKRCQREVEAGRVDFILGANKIPDREKRLHFSSIPAFINQTVVSAWTAKDHSEVEGVATLQALRRYKLLMVRGNSFGRVLDQFIASLEDDKRQELNDHEQVLTMTLLERGDYFLMPDVSFENTMAHHLKKLETTEKKSFRRIYSLNRKVPVHIAFPKQDASRALSEKWDQSIQGYYEQTDVDARIEYHLNHSESYLPE